MLREAYRALAPRGEMYFSDMYCDRRVPEKVSQRSWLARWRFDLHGQALVRR